MNFYCYYFFSWIGLAFFLVWVEEEEEDGEGGGRKPKKFDIDVDSKTKRMLLRTHIRTLLLHVSTTNQPQHPHCSHISSLLVFFSDSLQKSAHRLYASSHWLGFFSLFWIDRSNVNTYVCAFSFSLVCQ